MEYSLLDLITMLDEVVRKAKPVPLSKNSMVDVGQIDEIATEMRLVLPKEIQQAQNALESLNAELRVLSKNKSVQLRYARLATAIDMWIDDGFLDALTHLQISKAQKRIRRTITQVENIRRELKKLA
mgnify:CR=1 FL=1